MLNILSKDRIKHTLKLIDHEQRLDADVEDAVLDMTWNFIQQITNSACKMAKHRQSDILEAEDALIIAGTFVNRETI